MTNRSRTLSSYNDVVAVLGSFAERWVLLAKDGNGIEGFTYRIGVNQMLKL
jgi:hypothetical protein